MARRADQMQANLLMGNEIHGVSHLFLARDPQNVAHACEVMEPPVEPRERTLSNSWRETIEELK